jgi:hypothetical protein
MPSIAGVTVSKQTDRSLTKGGKNSMKARVIRLVMITVAMVLCGGTLVFADGGEPAPFPLCYPSACPK